MPFTAIRLEDGNTLIGCTLGNLVIEVDPNGKEVWRISNDDLPGKPINDACGVPAAAEREHGRHQPPRPGRTGQAAGGDPRQEGRVDVHRRRKAGIHHFQILDTNGKPLDNASMR